MCLFIINFKKTVRYARDLRMEDYKLRQSTRSLVGRCSFGPAISFVKYGEDLIDGHEMIRRSKKLGLTLDQRAGDNIIANQHEVSEELRHFTLPLTGTVWEGRLNNLFMPYLVFKDGLWVMKFRPLSLECCESACMLSLQPLPSLA